MSTTINHPPTSRTKNVPLWPWLLMPAVVLAVFLVLYKVRQRTPEPLAPTPPAASTPAETGQP